MRSTTVHTGTSDRFKNHGELEPEVRKLKGVLSQHRLDPAGRFVQVCQVDGIQFNKAVKVAQGDPELLSIWDSGRPGVKPVVMSGNPFLLGRWRSQGGRIGRVDGGRKLSPATILNSRQLRPRTQSQTR